MVIWLNILVILLAFVAGMCIFSLMSTLAYRVENEAKLNLNMYCESCGHDIKFYETIPVLSYIFLKGRCRYCGAELRGRDVLNELFGGLLTVFITLRFGFHPSMTDKFRLDEVLDVALNFTPMKLLGLITIILFIAMMDAVTLVDHDSMIIPDGFNIVLFVISIISIFTVPGLPIVERLIGIIVVALPMYLVILVIPNAFGGGDIKMMAAVGLMVGWKLALVGFLIGVLLGGFYGMYLMAVKNYDKKAHFAFGPFLCIGLVVAMFCGQDIIGLYTDYIAWMRSDV